MKAHSSTIVSALIAIIGISVLLIFYKSPESKKDAIDILHTENFVRTQMMSEGGVRTNYKEEPPIIDYATGRDVLSESQGLIMQYALESQNKPLFDEAMDYVHRELNREGIISYRSSEKYGVFSVNAVIDDFRIIRGLIDASLVFDSPEYLERAQSYADRLYKTNISGTALHDFYDAKHDKLSDSLALCYADFKTMLMLGEFDKRWQIIMEDSLEIVQGGYISDDFPLFYGSYKHSGGLYSDNRIETVQALITALHLAEIGQCPPKTIEYIKLKVLDKALYGQYSINGEPLDNVQSTAIYALASMLGKAIGDKELQEAALEHMRLFRVSDETSPLHGSYANTETLDAYSFDNLCALLACVLE